MPQPGRPERDGPAHGSKAQQKVVRHLVRRGWPGGQDVPHQVHRRTVVDAERPGGRVIAEQFAVIGVDNMHVADRLMPGGLLGSPG